ncbi:MAG: hypothetical protein AB1898_24425 [Acidobacteriota bacterium]
MTLEMTQEEQDLLAEILQSSCRDLHEEIRRTSTYEFKVILQGKVKVLETLLGRVSQADGPASVVA